MGGSGNLDGMVNEEFRRDDLIRAKGVLAICAAAILGMVYSIGFGGYTLGERIVHSFQYQNKPAKLVHVNKLLAPDRYYVLLNGKDKIQKGQFTSDSGQKINVSLYDYNIKKKEK